MDPNSGKIYRDVDELTAKKRGLIELTESEAAELESVAPEERMTTLRTLRNYRKSQSKTVRRAKNKAARKNKQRQRTLG